VRTIKTFLPILKFQAIEKNHMEGRIIQIGSVGGLISGAGGSSYHASKFALEGFINSLRDELKVFDLCVVTINPSFHRSPMTDQIYFKCQNIWNKLPPETRNQYGEGEAKLFLPWQPTQAIYILTKDCFLFRVLSNFNPQLKTTNKLGHVGF